MGYPTRVQLIKRKSSHQWYVNFPAAIAEAMEFEKSELEVRFRKKGLLRVGQNLMAGMGEFLDGD